MWSRCARRRWRARSRSRRQSGVGSGRWRRRSRGSGSGRRRSATRRPPGWRRKRRSALLGSSPAPCRRPPARLGCGVPAHRPDAAAPSSGVVAFRSGAVAGARVPGGGAAGGRGGGRGLDFPGTGAIGGLGWGPDGGAGAGLPPGMAGDPGAPSGDDRRTPWPVGTGGDGGLRGLGGAGARGWRRGGRRSSARRSPGWRRRRRGSLLGSTPALVSGLEGVGGTARTKRFPGRTRPGGAGRSGYTYELGCGPDSW